MLDVVLYQPEIPPNTGNIIRLCANFGCPLHLVGPLGFELEDRRLKRAGLDYHEWAEVRRYDSLDDYVGRRRPARLVAFTTRARHLLPDFIFEKGDALLFGPETRGLPGAVLGQIPPSQHLRIPMRPDSRSLNLSNAVAIACYEAGRQRGWPGMG